MFADQLVFPLRAHTSSDWAAGAIANFDLFLKDHAGAERKAHANCLAVLAKYQDRRELVETMLELAAEELQHFTEVVQILHKRHLTLSDSLFKDPYIEQLLLQLRAESSERLMDRLLLTSIIEARGCERFGLVGKALTESGETELGHYYTELARVEARHYGTYLRLARLYCPKDLLEKRLHELLDYEADLVLRLPNRAALH